MFTIQRRHGVFISSDFAAPVLALLTIEDQVREWAPDLDFQVVAQAIIISSIALIPCGPGNDSGPDGGPERISPGILRNETA